MPRITDARRELRRGQITQAAVRCFVRNGMERTSIADITAESRLSAGSIYAHYDSKAQLVQAVAQELLQRRVNTLTEYADSPHPPSPTELMTRLAAAINQDEARIGLQTWGEATTDPAIRAIVIDMADRMRDLLATTCEAWLIKMKGSKPGDARNRATDLAGQLMTIYQALLIRSALVDNGDALDQAAIAATIDLIDGHQPPL